MRTAEGVKKESLFLNRSRMDIIATILHEAKEGANKTHIMYRSNLSFRQLRTYLALLLNTELLRTVPERGGKIKFQTTKKGRAFLQSYNNLKILLAI